MTELLPILSKLGLAQYHDQFTEEGFETWETVLDITESDLQTLGVKLGHRRILQREIALAKAVSLEQQTPPNWTSTSELNRGNDGNKADGKSVTGTGAKRKYRRHAKADENAPERPPSAYVIFSNRMREDLKPQSLSFTATAKLLGERWQELTPEAKEPYESEASLAKEKYHAELAEYKTTKHYREYQQYLAEFKAKNSSASDDKRPKLMQEESTASSGSIGSYNTDPGDTLSGYTDSKGSTAESINPGGPHAALSGFSSPASSMSGLSALRTGSSSTVILGSASPRNLSPNAPLSYNLPNDSHRSQAGDPRQISNTFSKDTYNEIGQQHLPNDTGDIQQYTAHNPFAGHFTRVFSHGQSRPREPRRSALVPTLLHHSTSDSSSKSSVTSTWSSTGTTNSSIISVGTPDELKKTDLSLPPLTSMTATSEGRSLAKSESTTTRQSVKPFVGGNTSSRKAYQSLQSPSTTSSTGMKFESLQLPLPYNISFGQRPSPRPEHEPKLANIFDLQDIPGERRSLGNLTLHQELNTSPQSSTPPNALEPQHPPHIPKLPSLDTLPREDTQDNVLPPNADALSVLAYAGRLVGHEVQRPR